MQNKNQNRPYSTLAIEAVKLLGQQIKLKRKLLKWSRRELAMRAGISRETLLSIENGHMSCTIGVVFEIANIVGVNLFEADSHPLTTQIHSIESKISLLPKNTHKSRKVIDDDF